MKTKKMTTNPLTPSQRKIFRYATNLPDAGEAMPLRFPGRSSEGVKPRKLKKSRLSGLPGFKPLAGEADVKMTTWRGEAVERIRTGN
jgi:hypothetical protein